MLLFGNDDDCVHQHQHDEPLSPDEMKRLKKKKKNNVKRLNKKKEYPSTVAAQ